LYLDEFGSEMFGSSDLILKKEWTAFEFDLEGPPDEISFFCSK
jgi:hypothetical protein